MCCSCVVVVFCVIKLRFFSFTWFSKVWYNRFYLFHYYFFFVCFGFGCVLRAQVFQAWILLLRLILIPAAVLFRLFCANWGSSTLKSQDEIEDSFSFTLITGLLLIRNGRLVFVYWMSGNSFDVIQIWLVFVFYLVVFWCWKKKRNVKRALIPQFNQVVSK